MGIEVFWRGFFLRLLRETALFSRLLRHAGPREDPGVKSRMCPPYPQRVLKGD